MQAMNKLAVNARRHPRAGRELAAVSVSGNLKRNSRLLGDGQLMRRMHDQNVLARSGGFAALRSSAR